MTSRLPRCLVTVFAPSLETCARGGFLAAVLALSFRLEAAAPGGYTLEALKEGPPQEVSEAFRKELGGEGLRIKDPGGKPFVDLWVRKALAQVEKPREELNVKLAAVEEGTLLGVARFHRKSTDYKGNSFPPGVYTLRRGVQPVDGDHQGTSETRDFAILCQAREDTALTPLHTEELVKLSVKGTGIKHPTVLWLVPAHAPDAKLPRLVEDEERSTWTFELEIPAAEAGKSPLRLGIIVVGEAPH